MEENSSYLDLTILSAEDLKRKWLSGDQTVAVVWVDPSTKKTTSIVRSNGSNVQWHEKLILALNGADTLSQGKLLTIEIHAQGTWGDSLLGSVYVPLIELALDGEDRANTTLMYQIVRPSGKREGSIKFFAKIVKLRASGSIVPLSCSISSLPSVPPMLPLEDNHTGLGSNAFYPPASSAMCSVETNDERPSSGAYPPHPTVGVSFYPPQPLLSQNYATEHNASQHDPSPCPSHQMGSHPLDPQAYPPVNARSPAHTSPHLYPPHSNYRGIISYPPLSPQFLETPYPPLGVYPPPTETPYAPIALHPPYLPIAPHTSEMYLPASLYPYSNFSSPLYPPPYCQQDDAIHYPSL